MRSAAAARGTSLQAYLVEALRTQAAYLRRLEALARTARRLKGRPVVSDEAREAALEAIDAAHGERAGRLSDRSAR